MLRSYLRKSLLFFVSTLSYGIVTFVFAVNPIIEDIQDFPEEYLEKPLDEDSIRLTEVGQVICVCISEKEDLVLYINGERYKFPIPFGYEYIAKRGSIKLSPNGKYLWVLCTHSVDSHSYILYLKIEDIIGGNPPIFCLDFSSAIEENDVSLSITDISYGGEHIVVQCSGRCYLVCSNQKVFTFGKFKHSKGLFYPCNTILEELSRVDDSFFEISLRNFPYVEYMSESHRCLYKYYDNDLIKPLVFCGKGYSDSNIGNYWKRACEVIWKESFHETRFFKIPDISLIPQENLFELTSSFKEGIALCNQGNYLIRTKLSSKVNNSEGSSSNSHCNLITQTNNVYEHVIVGESDSKRWVTKSVDFPTCYSLDPLGCLYVMKTRALGQDPSDILYKYHIIQCNTTQPCVIELRQWLEEMGAIASDERVFSFAYCGLGDSIESGTYIFIVGKDSGFSERFRAIDVSFPKTMVSFQPRPITESTYCLPLALYQDRVVGSQGAFSFDSREDNLMKDLTWKAISENYLVGDYKVCRQQCKGGAHEERISTVGCLKTPQGIIELLPVEGASSCVIHGMHPKFHKTQMIFGESVFPDGKVKACFWLVPRSKLPRMLRANDSCCSVPEGCTYSIAKTCSEDTEFIIGQYFSYDGRQEHCSGCFWNRDKLVPLFSPKGNNYSDVFGIITKDKNVLMVGHSGILNSSSTKICMRIKSWPVVWVNGDVVFLTNKPNTQVGEKEAYGDGEIEGIATCITADGVIFGNYGGEYKYKEISTEGQAFICTDIDEGIQDLAVYLKAHYKHMKTILEEWELIYPTCVSKDGMIIAGLGRYGGQLTGFRLDLREAAFLKK